MPPTMQYVVYGHMVT